MDIIKISLKEYIHIKDSLTNISYLVEGPKNYPLQPNEKVVTSLTKFVQLGITNYVIIKNPVACNDKNEPLLEKFGQVKLRWGEEEIRRGDIYRDPFPLYPGEEVVGKISNFIMVQANQQLMLQAVQPFYDDLKKKDRLTGDEWMLRGPINYVPRIEAVLLNTINAVIIKSNSAIRVMALRDCLDKYGNKRVAGEQWLIREAGSYLHNVDEKIVENNVPTYTLTDKVAIQLKAEAEFEDVYGQKRKPGDFWLVTHELADLHILDVHEIYEKTVNITVLSSRQFCVILNPVVDGVTQYGKKCLRRGEASFFLQPGEALEGGVQKVRVLDENDALLLKAQEPYNDGKILRQPGDRWIVRGPCEFILPLELELIETRKAIPLDENEGIYVRNIKSGEIKIISGRTYLLSEDEELWNKELSPAVENIIYGSNSGSAFPSAEIDEKGEITYSKIESKIKREKHKVVTFRAPQNSAVQVFDYKSLKSRVIFGPELIKLAPHEEFTVLRLSGKKPKVENQIVNICILLGPDFMTDIIEVETKDHARLRLQLCYSWKFEVKNKNDQIEVLKLFTVNDFVGDACKNLAATIRGVVSTVSFETFHKNSSTIVKSAVFGVDNNNMIKNRLQFESNNLLIINVDIQSQEPVDTKTRENLSKSTNLSIQISNAIQQADSDHRQKIISEESRGKLELQKIIDETHAEKNNIAYLEKKIETDLLRTSGTLVAKAKANAKSNEIKGESLLGQAKLKIQALEIEEYSTIEQEYTNIIEEIRRKEEIIDVELSKTEKLSKIDVDEFQKTIKAIGKNTIIAMAKAGPEVQARLLQSLGIKSFLVTDGKNPINLFNTARGVVSRPKLNE